jgi:hypothetical protein
VSFLSSLLSAASFSFADSRPKPSENDGDANKSLFPSSFFFFTFLYAVIFPSLKKK